MWNQFISTVLDIHQRADKAHNDKHIIAVANSVVYALQEWRYDHLMKERNAIKAAAYLHDVDDPKVWPFIQDYVIKELQLHLLSEVKYPVANALLDKYFQLKAEQKDLIFEIISLTSTRHNHNSTVPKGEEWKLLVRDADRIQALGHVGIARCYAYTLSVGKPLFTLQTPRCKTLEELEMVATMDRFKAYNGTSASFIDHFYDKLLHIGEVRSGSKYMEGSLAQCKEVMVHFILDFGATNTLNVEYLEELKTRYCD